MSHPYHIVIAEDSDDVRALLVRIISTLYPNATLSTTADGLSAQQIVSQHTTDLLIASAHLALLDGLTLVRTLRSQQVTIPILLMSVDPAVEQAAVQLGADRFLLKPFTLQELHQALQALLP